MKFQGYFFLKSSTLVSFKHNISNATLPVQIVYHIT